MLHFAPRPSRTEATSHHATAKPQTTNIHSAQPHPPTHPLKPCPPHPMSRKRLYTHHYLQYEEESVFEEALETAAGLVEAYHSLDVGGASAGSSGSSRSSNSSSRGGAVLARGPTTQGGSSSGGGSGGGSNGSGGSRGLGRPSPVGRRQAQALRGRSSLGQGDLGRGAA